MENITCQHLFVFVLFPVSIALSMPANLKDIRNIILSLVFVAISIGFIKTTLRIWKSNRRLDEIAHEVSDLEYEKLLLEKKLAYQETPDYIEEEARNKLNFLKPGESVYVLSLDLEKDLSELEKSSRNVPRNTDQKKSNVRLWFELLF